MVVHTFNPSTREEYKAGGDRNLFSFGLKISLSKSSLVAWLLCFSDLQAEPQYLSLGFYYSCYKGSHLLIVNLSICAIGDLFRKLSPGQMHSMLLPTFSSVRLSVTKFILRSLIHLNLSFVQSDR